MNGKPFKKIILIDLDGVLNTYEGDFDKNFIPPIKEGAYDLLKSLFDTYEIKIFTTRNKMLTAKWLIDNKVDEFVEDITNVKNVCWLYIDDRAVKFDGNYQNLKSEIENFKPWYKK